AGVRRERLSVPAGPAVTQLESGELRHQVELGRPGVAEWDRPVLALPIGEFDVVAAVALRGVVEAVADDPCWARPVSLDVLPGRKKAQVRDSGLDHEASAWGEVLGDVAEARDLRFLRGEVVDRVEYQVGHRECALNPGRGHVADGHADGLAARFRA